MGVFTDGRPGLACSKNVCYVLANVLNKGRAYARPTLTFRLSGKTLPSGKDSFVRRIHQRAPLAGAEIRAGAFERTDGAADHSLSLDAGSNARSQYSQPRGPLPSYALDGSLRRGPRRAATTTHQTAARAGADANGVDFGRSGTAYPGGRYAARQGVWRAGIYLVVVAVCCGVLDGMPDRCVEAGDGIGLGFRAICPENYSPEKRARTTLCCAGLLCEAIGRTGFLRQARRGPALALAVCSTDAIHPCQANSGGERNPLSPVPPATLPQVKTDQPLLLCESRSGCRSKAGGSRFLRNNEEALHRPHDLRRAVRRGRVAGAGLRDAAYRDWLTQGGFSHRRRARRVSGTGSSRPAVFLSGGASQGSSRPDMPATRCNSGPQGFLFEIPKKGPLTAMQARGGGLLSRRPRGVGRISISPWTPGSATEMGPAGSLVRRKSNPGAFSGESQRSARPHKPSNQVQLLAPGLLPVGKWWLPPRFSVVSPVARISASLGRRGLFVSLVR